MRIVNLGILAHVDAGKTSLTERLLYAAGVIDEIGRVDDGNTQTDTLALERRRGITIKSAVVSFVVGDVTVNLIDTPGHPDFIAEVERVLGVLDGVVLVVSAVEGVQAQTRVLMRALHRLRLPTLFFINKIDRMGADTDRVLRHITETLTPSTVPMGVAIGEGNRGARVEPYQTGELVDALSRHDDAILAAYVHDDAVPPERLREALAAQTRRALVHPVYVGSAVTGAGVDELTAGIASLLPAADGSPAGPLSGTVFKVERGPAGEKVAYARLFTGTLHVRDRLPAGKVTAIQVFDGGTAVPSTSVPAGRIAKLWGLGDIRIGDPLDGRQGSNGAAHHFAPPTLETVVVPRDPRARGALHVALTQLAEQDPLINLRQDGALSVSLYGEVQKEVIQATLADDYGIEVAFRESTTICVERVVGTGAAVEGLHDEGNPFNAGVGLRIEAAPSGTGVQFRRGIELGSLPLPFLKAVADTVDSTLRQGIHGWQVVDCVVTLTHSGYIPPQGKRGQAFDASMSSTAGDFRNLTPLVLMTALRQAGTRVHEPIHRYRLEIPVDTLGAVSPVLSRLRAAPHTSAGSVLEGGIPAARVHELHQALPALTRGEGTLEWTFDHYAPVRGAVPVRPRTDHNPLHRKEYLLHVLRRV